MTPEIILGPPGTGKTTRLLSLVDEELSRGVPPDKIGYVSFTKRAAVEAIERAAEKFSLDKKTLRYFRTIHSMCFNALGLSNSDVFEGKKLLEFGDWIGYDVSASRYTEDGLTAGFTVADRALFTENLARVRCVPLREQYELSPDNLPWSVVERISRALEQYKKDHDLVDYTDMLRLFLDTDWSPNLEVLFVDEAQDLSMLQWYVVEKLARGARRVVVAGDDDQSIYRWAGAAVEHFVDMPGTSIVLGQSWRCPPPVQMLSDEIIRRVGHRRSKDWAPRDAEGVVDRVQGVEQVDFSGEDVLVLARNAYLLRELSELLRSDGIIFEQNGHPSVSRSILDAIRIWERLRRGETVTADEARRVYEHMSSGSGVRRGFKTLPNMGPESPVDMAYLREKGGLLVESIWHEALDRIPTEERVYMVRALQKGESLTRGRPRVRLSTIHGSKGGEADHVVVLRDMAQRTFREFRDNPEDEARVFYVAVTRAKRQLTVVAPRTNMSYDF